MPERKYNNFVFNLVHQASGEIGMIVSVVNMSLGVFLAVMQWFWVLVWFVYFGVNFLLYCLLEMARFLNYSEDLAKSAKSDQFDNESNYSNISASASTANVKESKFEGHKPAEASQTRYVKPNEQKAFNLASKSTKSFSNIQKNQNYQNSRENLVNSINLKYYL